MTDKEKSHTLYPTIGTSCLTQLLSVGLIDQNFPTTVEIAIGDNLLIYPWIKKLVRINKSFIVQRGLSMRQQLKSVSARMARYIHFAVTQKQENVWMSAKDVPKIRIQCAENARL